MLIPQLSNRLSEKMAQEFGRTLSTRRLHCHEHGAARRECRRLLQQAWHVRAMHQGRKRRDQRLSCRSFAANDVRLQLHALAYNLGNFLRTLAMPELIKDWSLTSLKEKLIKIGAKIVSHGPHSQKCVRRHLGAHRGTAAAARCGARVNWSENGSNSGEF